MGMNLLAESKFTVNGPLEVTTFDLFGMTFHLSESVVVEWFVVILLGVLFFVLGRNLKVKPDSRRQMAAEYIVGLFSGMVNDTMGVS